MIYPSIEELSRNGLYNRYMLCIATAKCAREITEEQIAQNQQFWRENKDDKLAASARRPVPTEKPVKTAINRLDDSNFTIYLPDQDDFR